MTNQERKWETKPLDCWTRFRELRANHYREVASAREQGKLLVTGSAASPFPLLDGLGDDVVYFGGEGAGASTGRDANRAISHLAAIEELGYSRDMCSYVRAYLGAMISDHFVFDGGPFPKPNFCFTMNWCDAGHAKWFQAVAEHYGVPLLVVDIPFGPASHRVAQQSEFVADQMAYCIEQMERITGRQFDDEKFIQGSRNYFASEALWAEVCLLNSAVPAPIDLNTIFGLVPAASFLRNKPECVAALRELRDEVKDRVARQISMSETERIRLVTDFIPPWSFIKMFRMMQDRGVVFVGIWSYLVHCGHPDFRPDGTVGPGKTPEELGLPMRTREDMLRIWGRKFIVHPYEHGEADPDEHTRQMVSFSKHLRADGILMCYNRGCPMQLNFRPEIKRRLESEGIPVAVFEANAADPRDTDASQITRQLVGFVDMLEQGEQRLAPASSVLG